LSTILVKNAKVVTVNEQDQIFDCANILINDKLIQKISAEPIKDKVDKIIDATGKLVLPGLINAHTHAAMTLVRGYCDNQNLDKWLETVGPIEQKMQPEDVYWGTMLAITEMIRNGITCFLDMYLHFGNISQAIIDSGIRGLNSLALIDIDQMDKIDLDNKLYIIKNWQNKGDGRLTTCFGPHAPYTCSGLLLRNVSNLARKNNLPIHIHLAETKKEISDIKRKYQMSPVELMVKYDFFSQNHVIVAHGIWLTDRDMTIFKNNKVSVVTCPSSNLKLNAGICPTQQLTNHGVNVAIGTDGAASNNSLDVLAEAKLVALVAKYFSQDASALSANLALKMATINGAKALKLNDKTGSIEEGKLADLIIMDLNGPQYLPNHNLISNLIYAGKSSDTETVIVNGKILMENKKIIAFDEEKVKREFNKRVGTLFEE